jgi:hypothetical protein
MTADTSAEAVERLAVPLEAGRMIAAQDQRAAAATLRALAGERDQWRANSLENKMIAEANLRDRDRLAAENARLQQRVEWLEQIREGAGRALCKRDGVSPDELIADGGHYAWQLHVYCEAQKALRECGGDTP